MHSGDVTMSNDEEIEELKRLIEEEKEEQRKRWRTASRKHSAYMLTPEYKKKRSDATSKRYKERVAKDPTVVSLRNARVRELRKTKQEQYVGSSKPSMCDVCNGGKRIALDHCHNTGKFRGWLCFRCNAILGQVQDDVILLEKLIIYLKAASHGQ